jgi:type VI secretion system secreted protein VgrG
MAYTQKDRAFQVSTPLPFDTLLFRRMAGTEELGRLFRYDLELLSEDDGIAMDDLLGSPMSIRAAHGGSGDTARYFHGMVSRFSLAGYEGRLAVYRAELRPWFWFLTRTADCRIFQDQSVPDIAAEIFREHGFSDFENRCTETYAARVYCVQYRETDFDFISRLFEQEGIYYYFTHEQDKHTLVLADSISGHSPCPVSPLPYQVGEVAGTAADAGCVQRWLIEKNVRPGAYAHTDYDFVKPRADLAANATTQRDYAHAKFEVFDYPARANERDLSDTYSRRRIEELQTDYEEASGDTNCRSLSTGCLFELEGFPRDDQNREYLVKSIAYEMALGDYQASGSSAAEEIFQVSFRAMDSGETFRAASITPKPRVEGPQTAMVVGKQGEEIWTDEYGRVKVRFHWDREGEADENSSCWIRVAQVHAGKGWGGMTVPRIGQEVIVDFLEGDPDRPIITGRVYNDEAMPPYALPANATMTAFKSNSSKGGGGFNEIRLEDKKGSEQFFVHAEKNQDVRVKNDAFEWIGNERHLIVKKDQLELIEGDKHQEVKGDQNEKIGGTVSMNAGMDLQQKVGMNHALDAGMEVHVKAGMNVIIEAGMSITLKAGGGFIVVGPAGVTISGTPVLINSGGSAGSGSGCSPDVPKAPLEAADAEPGSVNQPPQAVRAAAPEPEELKPLQHAQAETLARAQQDGAPFCEKCEEAREANQAG